MKKLAGILSAAMVGVMLLSGCGTSSDTGNNGEAQSSNVKISIVGSTSVQPLAEAFSEAYANVKSGAQVDVQGVGSSAGIKAAIDGTCDIGTSSRDLKEDEKSQGIVEHKIAVDGIGVVVNPNNPVGELTKDQVVKIFKGEITNWKDVGGADQEIIVVSREEGSGTRSAFEEILELQEERDGKTYSLLANDALIAEGNGAVKSNIASKEAAIGYLSIGVMDDSVKGIKLDGADPTEENVVNGSYQLSRPFLMVTKGEATGDTKDFIDWILSEDGQKIVTEEGFIAV